jgi:hypothetical protein
MIFRESFCIVICLSADSDACLAGGLTSGPASNELTRPVADGSIAEPKACREERGRGRVERKERFYIGLHLALKNKCR